MNAQQLYDIVKDLPREAWPETLIYQHEQPGESDYWYSHKQQVNAGPVIMPTGLSVVLFEASLMRWLLEHENTDAMTIIPAADKSAHFRIEADLFRDPVSKHRNDKCTKTYDGSTFIEALAAAVREVRKEKQA